MTSPTLMTPPVLTTPGTLMTHWLVRQLPAQATDWLLSQADRLGAGASERDIGLAISLVPRRLGKADLLLRPEDMASAAAARSGWDPRDWSVDQAGRLVLLLSLEDDGPAFARRLQALFATADLGEAMALLRGLPLYPDPPLHMALARNGGRTGMRPIFEAMAHRNPYPAEMFDQEGWNQLVLKALFIETTLSPIQHLDRRANPTLMRMLCDYAHERWAAGRAVSPELWRCVGPWADAGARDDLQRVLRDGDPAERAAAHAALAAADRRHG